MIPALPPAGETSRGHMNSFIARSAMILLAVAPVVSNAQVGAGGPQDPPKVLWIGREMVKPGKARAHIAWEKGWPAAYTKANYPTTYLAMTSMSGTNEAWYMTGYASWDAVEKDNAKSDANPALAAELRRLNAGESEYLGDTRQIYAEYVPELSYKSKVDLSKMRYMDITTFRVRPGHEGDFSKIAGMFVDAYTKGNIDAPWAVYRVATGAQGPTYYVMSPIRSLAVMDRGAADFKIWSDKMGAEGMAAMSKLSSDIIAISDDQLFALNPSMSYLSKEFKAGDPAFWK
jgi:hypothetical protein